MTGSHNCVLSGKPSTDCTASTGGTKKHKAVFEEGLGTLKGIEAELQVGPGAKPKYFKARSVPYFIKCLVEEELDWLEKEGTIEPIAISEWAAPIQHQ